MIVHDSPRAADLVVCPDNSGVMLGYFLRVARVHPDLAAPPNLSNALVKHHKWWRRAVKLLRKPDQET